MTDNPQYSVVIPTYNATEAIHELIERLQIVFEQTLRAKYEIILVDDGSNSAETKSCLSKASDQKNVTLITLTRNFGKPGAVLCGLAHSRGQQIITIDDDLQQSPEDIPALIELGNHDVVSATHKSKKHTLIQRVTSRIKQMFDELLLQQPNAYSPLKIFQRHIVDGMLSIQTNRPFIPALIHQVTSDIVFVETPHSISSVGRSRYTLGRRLSQFSNLLVGNSDFLLRAFSAIGYLFAALSVVILLAVISRKLSGAPVSAGWTSIIVAVLAVGGLNMAAIGLTGQYFIRILDVASHKPSYIVRKVTRNKMKN